MSDEIEEDENSLRYDRMVERALRSVVREAVEEVMDTGLPGDHHFYITFMTDYPGVDIPEYLQERYPGEMTIVLQYQFYDLEVDEDTLRVTLSFNNVPEKLVIPMQAITIFADPSVNFALQFQPLESIRDEMDEDELEIIPIGDNAADGEDGEEDDGKRGEVISLDQFRKKDD